MGREKREKNKGPGNYAVRDPEKTDSIESKGGRRGFIL